MKRLVLSLALAVASSVSVPVFAQLSVAAAAAQAATDPAIQILEMAEQFRRNDVAALVSGGLPPDKYDELLAEYERERLEPISDADRAEFLEGVGRLTAEGAVDRLMEEITPKLQEGEAQSAGLTLMAIGALNMAVTSPESDLSVEQREQLRMALPALEHWLSVTDFFSPELARSALTALAEGVRKTGVDSLDTLRSLSLEQVMGRAGQMLAAGKEAARVYGIDLDAIASTLEVEVLELAGDTARVRTTIEVFNAPIASEHELVRIGGRWYGKQASGHWQFGSDDQADADSDANPDVDVDVDVNVELDG